MDEKQKMDMIFAMRKYGGNFVQSLGLCFLNADKYNLQKLLKTFPEYVKQYSELAKIDKERQAE
jgi:hypothetical protein